MRERLLKGNIAQVFFHQVVEQARAKDLLSDEHFTVDGTLIEAWAGQKSFQRKDAPPPEDGGSRGPNFPSFTQVVYQELTKKKT